MEKVKEKPAAQSKKPLGGKSVESQKPVVTKKASGPVEKPVTQTDVLIDMKAKEVKSIVQNYKSHMGQKIAKLEKTKPETTKILQEVHKQKVLQKNVKAQVNKIHADLKPKNVEDHIKK